MAFYMDNRGFQKEPERDIRIPMRETGTAGTLPPSLASTSTGTPTVPKICRPEVCRRARIKYTQRRETSDSPWHRKKTIMLVGTIILLTCWAIVYGILSQLGML